MKFELNGPRLNGLCSMIDRLEGDPTRVQRRTIIGLAEECLPKWVVTDLFLAIGCGGALSQPGAAHALLDHLLPAATYRAWSETTGRGRLHWARLGMNVNGELRNVEAREKRSPGLALTVATMAMLASLAHRGQTELEVEVPRVGVPTMS